MILNDLFCSFNQSENKEELEVLTSTTGWPLFLVKALPPIAKIARETPAANTLKLVMSLHMEVENQSRASQS